MAAFSPFDTPFDLLRKLERDFDRMNAAPDDFDAAFNFFVTAEHMLDWAMPGRASNTDRIAARASEVLLQVTSHLANGLKHFKVEDRRHESVSHIDAPPGAFDPRAFDPHAFQTNALVVTLDGEAARRLGPEILAIDLAEQVLNYWRDRLQRSQP